jgi:hypothetical protein
MGLGRDAGRRFPELKTFALLTPRFEESLQQRG